MDWTWTGALEEDRPNDTPAQRFTMLAHLIPASAGNLITMIQTARAMEQAQDEHDSLDAATRAVHAAVPGLPSAPSRRRI